MPTYLDNGCYIVKLAYARQLAGGKLPGNGREKLVVHQGTHWWLGRTQHMGRTVWVIRASRWHLDGDGNAVL